MPDTPAITAAHVGEISRLAHAVADRAVLADIETNAVQVLLPESPTLGRRWLDLRPMVDPREVPAQVMDMHAEAIAYAHLRGLVVSHPAQPHLVRIVRRV